VSVAADVLTADVPAALTYRRGLTWRGGRDARGRKKKMAP
jgi:hypothetical protein